MQNKWQLTMTAAALAALLLTACGHTKTPAPSPGQTASPTTGNSGTTGSEPVKEPSAEPKKTEAPQESEAKSLKLKAYYGDSQLEKLVEKDVTVTYKKAEEKYVAALNALKKAPDNDTITLFTGFTFKSAVLKNGQLTVDLSMSDESRLGSGGEAFILQALEKMLFQFSEVATIEVLVDGKQTESLMGHMDLQHPIKRKS